MDSNYEAMNDTNERMNGLFAALITPVDAQGQPNANGLRHLLDFVLERGADGVCLGGGTAEYPHFSLDDRKRIVETAARHLGGDVPFVAAIGAPTLRGVIELGRHAVAQGAHRLLLPMPYFFRYEQQDLAAYVREAVQTLEAPCLVYNLAAFTNPLHPETTLDLLRTEPNVVGLKDSSGDREALVHLAAERSDGDTLLCGSDGLLLAALEAGWDGAISGIASCAPDVLSAVYRHYRAGDTAEATRCMGLLDELVALVGRLPFPWSIRVACEVRGYPNGPLPWPLSNARAAEVDRLKTDYARWFDTHLPTLNVPGLPNAMPG